MICLSDRQEDLGRQVEDPHQQGHGVIRRPPFEQIEQTDADIAADKQKKARAHDAELFVCERRKQISQQQRKVEQRDRVEKIEPLQKEKNGQCRYGQTETQRKKQSTPPAYQDMGIDQLNGNEKEDPVKILVVSDQKEPVCQKGEDKSERTFDVPADQRIDQTEDDPKIFDYGRIRVFQIHTDKSQKQHGLRNDKTLLQSLVSHILIILCPEVKTCPV